MQDFIFFLAADARRRPQTFFPADLAGKNTSIATRLKFFNVFFKLPQ